MLLIGPVILVLQIPFRGAAALPKKRLPMNSLAMNQLSETAYASVRVPDNGSDNELIRHEQYEA
jgi:hypothetical protein